MKKLVFILLGLFCFSQCKSGNEEPEENANVFFENQMYSNSEITSIKNIIYSTKPNYNNLQYTSEDTKNTEILSSTLSPQMDIYLAPNAKFGKKIPLILFIHGGSFEFGDKANPIDQFLPYAKAGYVVASINYRLTQNNQSTAALRYKAISDALEDTQNAIRFLKKNANTYSIDTERIAVLGISAGGALSLLNAVETDKNGLINDYSGFSSKVNAGISTGATLVTAGQPSLLTFDANDSPVLLFHAKETDSFTGATWTNNAIPTQNAFVNSGNQCIAVAQPDITHTISLQFQGNYWGNIQPFLKEKLHLSAYVY